MPREVREPTYIVIVRESGTNRSIYHETVHGRLSPHFTDRDSRFWMRIKQEDNEKYFLRTPDYEAAHARRRR